MEKPYVTPSVEFIRITGDALTGSNEEKADSQTRNIMFFMDDSDDFSGWTLF